ncbi:MAG TPA: hypothetical protein VFX41_13260 [Actinomycetales bacterium]|nr:hypothetical protein [Actinomycetales bacterium]
MLASKSERLDELLVVAAGKGGILTFADLRELKVTRAEREAHLAARRWELLPNRGVIVHTGPVVGNDAWWKALAEVGVTARLGGITSLMADGLTGYDEPLVHVWVTQGTHKGRPEGVRVHETRRWASSDAVDVGIPRAKPAVATVQAALWAKTARQAALALVMPIQQRLARATDVAEELRRVKRHKFRRPLLAAIQDIVDGAHSLNELDFARECRERGLPEPSRQVVRRTSQGRVYLDVYWEAYRVALEVNGAGHGRLDRVLADEIRSIDIQLRRDAAVQISVLTLRLEPDHFFAKLAELLRANGWLG